MQRNERAAGAFGMLAFFAAWELVVRSGLAQFDYLPAPTVVLQAMIGLLSGGDVITETVHTVSATLIGWFCAMVIGLTGGAVLALSETARVYSMTTVATLRPLPAVALIPLALLLFGFSLSTELFVIIIPSVWPVLVNTMGGIAGVPDRLHDVGCSLRLGRLERIRKILIPAAAPFILVGCRLSLGVALVLAVITEMIGNPDGLGNAVVREAQALHPDLMFDYVLITGGLGIVLNAAVNWASRLLLPGHFNRERRL